MKLGIGTYTFMWSIGFPGVHPDRPLDPLGLLSRAQQLGVKVIQFGPNLSLEHLSDDVLAEVIRCTEDWGLELEVGTRGLETGHLKHQISIAQRVGANLLRTVPELPGGELPPAPKIAECLRDIIPELSAAGIKLAIENGGIPAEDLKQILDSVCSPWVGVTLDTVNSLAVCEGWRHVASILAPYTMCLHVKDFVVERVRHMMGFKVEGRPAGKGQLDIPWLLETLHCAGVSPNAILELWPPEQKNLQETIALEQAWAVESISYLRNLISD
jgi:sugar phosphate isomerase/epimerase